MTKPVTPQEMFELWQKMVNPGAYPLQSLMFPVLDPKELERKINELRVVEHWLRANVNMVQMTIKSLEFQLSLVKGGEKAAQAIAEGAKGAKGEGAADAANPAAWMWKMMAQAANPEGVASPPKPAQPAARPRRKKP
jgi:hypothetical protein